MSRIRQRISFSLTIILTIILVGLVWFILNPLQTRTDLDSLHYVGPSAGRMMERHLGFYEGYDDTGFLENAIYTFLFGSRESVELQAIRVYEEVLKYFEKNPDHATPWGILNTKARKLITIAETQGKEALIIALQDFNDNPEEEVIAEAVKFAYLDKSDNQQPNPEIFTGASLLPVGWAADHLRLRIAQKVGHDNFAQILQERLLTNGKALRQRVMQMVSIMAVIIVIGVYLILRFELLHIPSPWRTGILARPWGLLEGYALAVRAAVFGISIWIILMLLSNTFFRPGILSMWSTLFASLPMLWLMYHYLLKPRGLNFRTAFGLSVLNPGLRNVIGIVFGLLALEWIGLLLIGWGTWKLGFGNHWAHSLQERLVFGPTETVVLSAIGIVLWSPIFEEIGFRGLVYTTLRSHFTPKVAILISAALFSALHLNSLAGFISIFWSGIILAYAYERYHSLLPGMVIHSLGNLLNLSIILLFYR